jgi:XRE family aerobic/anaerobic benzoate catabolism transcriptional regulator
MHMPAQEPEDPPAAPQPAGPALQAVPGRGEALGKHPFLVQLGERVRALRARRGMTRKALAAATGVSERHLSNLELGQGNASILILLDVAQA